MKYFISGFLVLFLSITISLSASAASGDLFVQVDLVIDFDDESCSILRVMPDGTFTEFVSAESVLALIGLTECEMGDTGLTVADNGDVYFSEDISGSIIKATPSGALSTFVSKAQITAATGEEDANPQNGMVIGPDGDLYFNDGISESILKATIPGGVVSVVVSEAEIIAVTGNSGADLQGGIAFDCRGNLYITDDFNPEHILVLNPSGALRIFVTEQQINNATGFNSTDLDVGMTFFGGSLYVLDDGECNCVLQITMGRDISVFVSNAEITAATGNGSANLEGGIAVNQSQEVFFGDTGDFVNILVSPPGGSSVSLFVTNQELVDFYTPLVPELRGSMAFEGVDACTVVETIPTLSEWGLVATAAVLGIVGIIAVRRKKATI